MLHDHPHAHCSRVSHAYARLAFAEALGIEGLRARLLSEAYFELQRHEGEEKNKKTKRGNRKRSPVELLFQTISHATPNQSNQRARVVAFEPRRLGLNLVQDPAFHCPSCSLLSFGQPGAQHGSEPSLRVLTTDGCYKLNVFQGSKVDPRKHCIRVFVADVHDQTAEFCASAGTGATKPEQDELQPGGCGNSFSCSKQDEARLLRKGRVNEHRLTVSAMCHHTVPLRGCTALLPKGEIRHPFYGMLTYVSSFCQVNRFVCVSGVTFSGARETCCCPPP